MKQLYSFEGKSYKLNLDSTPSLYIINEGSGLTALTLTYYDLVFLSSKLNVISNITNVGLDMNTLIQRINQGSYNFIYKTEELISIDFRLTFDQINKKILTNISIEGYTEYENVKWDSIKFISEMFNSIKIGWFVLISNSNDDRKDVIEENIPIQNNNETLVSNSIQQNKSNVYTEPEIVIKEESNFSIFDDVNGFESDKLEIDNLQSETANSSDFTNSQHNINPLEMF